MMDSFASLQKYCFYLDIKNNAVAKTLSKRIEDLGLRQEVFLTESVTHVVREEAPKRCQAGWSGATGAEPSAPRGCSPRPLRRADAMLERVLNAPNVSQPTCTKPNYVVLSVQKAILFLDRIYDTFFAPQRKVKIFKGHFIKIEFLDSSCRPVFKEFDEWPSISTEPDPPKEKKLTIHEQTTTTQTPDNKMTKKSRPKPKEREDIKETKAGYCEMCNTEYLDVALHRRSPHHLAFIRDQNNFLALDSLISTQDDVAAFLDKANAPLNGERRSQRKHFNGDSESKSRRSESQESEINGHSPQRANGDIDKRNNRCKKSTEKQTEDKQYYKVVTTKLRSSGGFQVPKPQSPLPCNGGEPLVVKFRRVRRSELSVLSDEAEQFMFPRRPSSSSSSEEDDEEEEIPEPPPDTKRRSARPTALKEESSEDDSWDDIRKKKKLKGSISVKRGKLPVPRPVTPPEPPTPVVEEVKELPKEDNVEKCLKWVDGRLKATPLVEQLQFAFESVPNSEPWYDSFKRQDQDKQIPKNIPEYFALYLKSPKLPYEIGQLPPLKPNCCALSDLVKKDEKTPGPSRSYGTRGNKKQKIRKRTAAILALENHPRKSPREHASTLAILGSASLLHQRKNTDDAKSTASEDTASDSHSNTKSESIPLNGPTEMQQASERLQQFLSEVFEDAAEYEVPEEVMEGEPTVTTSTNIPDVVSLVSECDACDIIRDEVKESTSTQLPVRRTHKFKKKNRTGWPKSKKRCIRKEESCSTEAKVETSLDSSVEPDSIDDAVKCETESDADGTEDSKDKVDSESDAEAEDKAVRPRRKSKGKPFELCEKVWALQPVVRVARVEPRLLRSAAKQSQTSRRSRAYRFR